MEHKFTRLEAPNDTTLIMTFEDGSRLVQKVSRNAANAKLSGNGKYITLPNGKTYGATVKYRETLTCQ